MRIRSMLALAVLAALALAAPASAASYRVGLSEQNRAVFADRNWQALHLRLIRYIVPWDWYRNRGQAAEVGAFMGTALRARQEVLVTFTARRGCFSNGRYSRSRACRAPSVSAYRSAVRRFRRLYPWVRTYAPWNEANHVSQPTMRSPSLAARYYATMRRECRGCKVMAADVLDSSNVASWLRSFLRASHGAGRIWGLHNYKDVNRRQSRGLVNVLRTVPGEVWLTETGGIVTFLPDFPPSVARAASATRYMFALADRYRVRRRGLRSKVSRLYVYRWYGERPGARFDAGLVGPTGRPRRALTELRRQLRHHRR